jgi:hypothetical protein
MAVWEEQNDFTFRRRATPHKDERQVRSKQLFLLDRFRRVTAEVIIGA